MAGIGKYPKGKKFELKSGNNPAFKMMAGDSPITNEFGVGKGTSPYLKSDDGDDDDDDGEKNGWKKAAKIAIAGLTSGLDAVYGTGKIKSMSFSDKKDDDGEKENKK